MVVVMMLMLGDIDGEYGDDDDDYVVYDTVDGYGDDAEYDVDDHDDCDVE